MIGTFSEFQQVIVGIIAQQFVQFNGKNPVDPFHFLIGKIQVYPTSGLNQIGTSCKCKEDIVINRNLKIGFNGIHQQFCAAVGISRIQTIPAISGNFYISIPQKGSDGKGIALGVHGKQNHGIRPSTFFGKISGIGSNHQNIPHIGFIHCSSRRCTIFGVHFIHTGNTQQRQSRIQHKYNQNDGK